VNTEISSREALKSTYVSPRRALLRHHLAFIALAASLAGQDLNVTRDLLSGASFACPHLNISCDKLVASYRQVEKVQVSNLSLKCMRKMPLR